MAKILGLKLPAFRAGYLVNTFPNVISRGTPESDPLVYGDLVKLGSATGSYEPFDGSEADDSGFVGIVVHDHTHIEYDGNNSSIQFGKYGDILVEGDIIVPVSVDVATPLVSIVEGGTVAIGSDGKVAVPVGQSPKMLTSLRFLGITEIVDGVTLTAIRKRMF